MTSTEQRMAARRLADEQARRAMEDRALAHAAGLHADDRSPEAEQARETAASIAEHQEMAAKRRVWAAADALAVVAPPMPSDRSLRYAGVTRQQWYEAQAGLLECLHLLRREGVYTAAMVEAEATRDRSPLDMVLAAEGLARGTDHLQDRR